MKKIKYLLSVIFAIFMLVACGEKKEEAKTEAPVELKKLIFYLIGFLILTTLDFMLLRKKDILQKKELI